MPNPVAGGGGKGVEESLGPFGARQAWGGVVRPRPGFAHVLPRSRRPSSSNSPLERRELP